MTYTPPRVVDSPAGRRMGLAVKEETVVLNTGGTDTNSSAEMLDANSIVLAVAAEVTTTITGRATTWKVGGPVTQGRFVPTQTTLTAGFRVIGMEQMSGGAVAVATGPTQASSAALRITTDLAPSAGAIRLTVYSIRVQ